MDSSVAYFIKEIGLAPTYRESFMFADRAKNDQIKASERAQWLTLDRNASESIFVPKSILVTEQASI